MRTTMSMSLVNRSSPKTIEATEPVVKRLHPARSSCSPTSLRSSVGSITRAFRKRCGTPSDGPSRQTPWTRTIPDAGPSHRRGQGRPWTATLRRVTQAWPPATATEGPQAWPDRIGRRRDVSQQNERLKTTACSTSECSPLPPPSSEDRRNFWSNFPRALPRPVDQGMEG